MNKEHKRKIQERWFRLNEPTGIALGYPDCCIRAFGDNAPELMENTEPTKDDRQRFRAGCINNEFTGFIPCHNHAK